MAKILLVEDDVTFSDMVRDYLERDHHIVEICHDGKEGLEHLKLCQYDIIILDWNLPDTTGVQLCQAYRSIGGGTPVLMLTGMNRESEKVEGLDAGADDYLTKPVSLRELAARLRALLRRPSVVQCNVLTIGELEMDSVKHEVRVGGHTIHLLPLEFDLLAFLMRHPNQVFSHNVLVERVWKTESIATAEAVRTCVMSLRKKIAQDEKPSLIKTVHGLGYKLETE